MIVYQLINCFICSIPVGVISLTLSKAYIFHSFREWVVSKSKFFGEVIQCPFCTSFWVAFLLMPVFEQRLSLSPFDNVFTIFLSAIFGWLAIVAFASLTAGTVYRMYSSMVDISVKPGGDDEPAVETESEADGIRRWLLYHKTTTPTGQTHDGISSPFAMIQKMYQEFEILSVEQMATSHPKNVDDFRSCYELISFVPNLKQNLWSVAEISPAWSLIVRQWDNIVKLLESRDDAAVTRILTVIDKKATPSE